jgi:DNA-binding MarR family transcriptional regulator
MRDDDARRLRSQLAALQRRLRREAIPADGISMTAHHVLGAVARLPAGSGPRQVADELNMASSNVAAALRELEHAGYLFREKDPDDARRTRLFPTDAGQAMMSERQSERDLWFLEAVSAMLSPEEQELLLQVGDLMEQIAGYQSPVPLARKRRNQLGIRADGAAS